MINFYNIIKSNYAYDSSHVLQKSTCMYMLFHMFHQVTSNQKSVVLSQQKQKIRKYVCVIFQQSKWVCTGLRSGRDERLSVISGEAAVNYWGGRVMWSCGSCDPQTDRQIAGEMCLSLLLKQWHLICTGNRRAAAGWRFSANAHARLEVKF